MPSVAVQATLFLSSYAPLLLIFALLDSWGSGMPSVICVVVAVMATVVLFAFLGTALRTKQPLTVHIARATHRDGDAIAYFVTYLVPFVGISGKSGRLQLALLVLLLVIGALYLRSHLFYVNPLLSLAGYRLYEAETSQGRVLIVITKRKYIAPATRIRLITLSDYVFMETDTR